MKPRITLITLGVEDLPLGAPSATDFCLAHNVASKAEVDAVMADARAAGAVIVKPA